MALLLTVLLSTMLASSHASVGPSTNSSFCTESKECLEYQLVCRTDEYEVRHYSPTRWVSTDAEAYFMGVGAAMAFRRLFQYITGANDAGAQMEMTAPVLVKIPEETKMWEPAIYTLNFPLPAAYQDKHPAPTNDKLYFTEMPEMDVYVRSYGGWMLSVTSRLHAHMLTKELQRVDAPYNRSYHYGVGYDSPLKLLNRHNEVWYIAEGEPVCSDPQEPTPSHTLSPLLARAPRAPLPSDPLPLTLSHPVTLDNASSVSNMTDAAAQPTTPLPTHQPAESASPTAQVVEDGTSNCVIVESVEPERDVMQWDSTATVSVTTQADSNSTAVPDASH
ncbi:heme-binding protein 1 [Synchiropus splendidus]|uniref:heme-binding protein 1 n=1 Tax=Synchiropus splendidus TaxID=270530 RepID=UPI00237DF571|nr:heme-binding protein 1 [Synchiropus splendidus]